MNKNFIENIEIKNFKCFDDFKAKEIGHINLIGGKNNSGKTSFMEACYLCLQNTESALTHTIIARNKRNYIYHCKDSEFDEAPKLLKELLDQNFYIIIDDNKTSSRRI